MAKVKNPLLSGDASGTIGQSVHRNVGGLHVVQASPTKLWVDSTLRAAWRQRNRELFSAYVALSDSQRALWNIAAATVRCAHRLSHIGRLDGVNLFVKRNSRLYQWGYPILEVPNEIAPPPFRGVATFYLSEGILQIEVIWTDIPPEATTIFEVYIHLSVPGHQTPRRSTARATFPYASSFELQAIGSPPAGRHGLWIRPLDTLSGMIGPEQYQFMEVEA